MHRSTVLLVAIAAFLAGTPVHATDSTTSTDAFTGKVHGDKVRLRAEPDLESHIIHELHTNDLLVIDGESEGFYSVRPSTDIKAYVFRTYVLDGTVEGNNVNVRLKPDLESPIIAQLNTGDKVNGTISEAHNKWLEITIPDSVRFYVAKDFIEKVGSDTLISDLNNAKASAEKALTNAHRQARSELQKPFEEISLEKMTDAYLAITKEYSQLEAIVAQADEAYNVVQDAFLEKKIAFLESKARGTSSAGTNAAVTAYLKRLQEFEGQYSEVEIAEVDSVPTKSTVAAVIPVAPPRPATSRAQANSNPQELAVWEPVEQTAYEDWSAMNSSASKADFDQHEQLNAKTLSGVLKPYKWSVKNKPGDYVLVSERDQLPLAYLYSTKVDLTQRLGKQVTVKGSPRPNNHFAFPAFHVISVE